MKACNAHDRDNRYVSKLLRWKKSATLLLILPSTYVGLLMLIIACTLIFMPEISPKTKDFLMVAFACIAMLPECNRDSHHASDD